MDWEEGVFRTCMVLTFIFAVIITISVPETRHGGDRVEAFMWTITVGITLSFLIKWIFMGFKS